MDAHVVALCQQLFKRNPLHICPLSRVGVIDQDPHAKGQRDIHHGLANSTTSDNPNRLTLQLNVRKVVNHSATTSNHSGREAGLITFPQALLLLEEGYAECQDVRDGQRGNRLVAVGWDVAHHQTLLLGGSRVNVVVARSSFTDPFHGGRQLFDELCRHRPLLGHHDRRILAALEKLLVGACIITVQLGERVHPGPIAVQVVLGCVHNDHLGREVAGGERGCQEWGKPPASCEVHAPCHHLADHGLYALVFPILLSLLERSNA
mmetsp:Transcript_4049/g.9447  ORF Transcript_4049/g.9447 Transcript_4049/m.9447 type:complete len:263 (-) Transcript_4049:3-791(-)